MPLNSVIAVQRYFEALVALHDRLRDIGSQPDDNLKKFWNEDLSDLAPSGPAQESVRAVIKHFGGLVPVSFPDVTVRGLLDQFLPPALASRLLNLYFEVAVQHHPELGAGGPQGIRDFKIEEVFVDDNERSELRDTLLAAMHPDFTDGKPFPQATETVDEDIEDLLS